MFQIRKLSVLIVFLFSFISLNALSPEWLWATQVTGSGGENSNAITTDNQGNQYITGWFQLLSDFGDTTLASSGQSDVFVAKLDASGNWLWAVKAGGSGSDSGIGICVDSAGNIFVTGYFNDTASFGSHSLSSLGPENIFVAALDTNGNWLWATGAGSIYGALGRAVCLENTGNIIVSGSFSDTCHFGNIELTCVGMNDLFVAKLSSSGSWQWAVQAGAGTHSVGTALAVDSNDNIFVAGETPTAVSFGAIDLPGVGGFIAKLNATGSWQWAVRAGGPSNDPRKGLAVDNAGNVYLAGSFYQPFSFGSTTLIGAQNGDGFIAKLSPEHNWLWAKMVDCQGTVYCHDLALDSMGNVYIAGEFWSMQSASFGPFTITGNGDLDIFAAKLDSNGNWLWAKQAGGSYDDEGLSISVDNDFNAYISGYFHSAALFYPHYLASIGYYKAYVAKLSYWVANEDALAPSSDATVFLNNYPNPFVGNTTVTYKLPALSHTELCIYNIRGQLVRKLLSISQASGEHTVTWDGKDKNGRALAPGMYLCRISSGDKQETHKMLLIR